MQSIFKRFLFVVVVLVIVLGQWSPASLVWGYTAEKQNCCYKTVGMDSRHACCQKMMFVFQKSSIFQKTGFQKTGSKTYQNTTYHNACLCSPIQPDRILDHNLRFRHFQTVINIHALHVANLPYFFNLPPPEPIQKSFQYPYNSKLYLKKRSLLL